jgi:uncharacterized protein (TIGR03437 family)
MWRTRLNRSLTFLILLTIAACADSLFAQTSLSLSSASALPGGTALMNLSLSSSAAASSPAALQWTLTYPAESVAHVNVTLGAAASAAGKSVSCRGDATTYVCIVSGMNKNAIGNGIVAVVSLTLTAGAVTSSIGISNLAGATPLGDSMPVSGTGAMLSVTTPFTVTSLSCTPGSLASGASAACTVTLSKPAPPYGSIVVGISASGSLTAPASVTIEANSDRATFPVVAGTILTSQTAAITASLAGSSVNAEVSLQPAAVPTSLTCAPSTLPPYASTACTISVSKSDPSSTTTLTLSTNSGALTLPASVTIPANSSNATFSLAVGPLSAPQTASIVATLGSASVATSLTLSAPANAVSVSALRCDKAVLGPNESSVCSVTVANADGAVLVTLARNDSALSAPAMVAVPLGAPASFTVAATSFVSSQTAALTATLNSPYFLSQGYSQTVVFSLEAPQTAATAGPLLGATDALLRGAFLLCTPTVYDGQTSICEIRLQSAASSDSEVEAISAGMAVPQRIAIRKGDSHIRFAVTAGRDATPGAAFVTVRSAGSAVSLLSSEDALRTFSRRKAAESALEESLRGRRLEAATLGPVTPGSPSAIADNHVHFPDGAPAAPGTVDVANNGVITADSERPTIGRLEPATCVPGAAAVLRGRLFSRPGQSTRVLVNDYPVRILAASPTMLSFICPDLPPGATLTVSVEVANHASESLQTTVEEVAPAILAIGIGSAVHALAFAGDGSYLAALPSSQFGGHPAHTGDMLSVDIVGVRCHDNAWLSTAVLTIGPEPVAVTSVLPADGSPGVCQIQAIVPEGVSGGQVPVTLQASRSNGIPVLSNTAFIAIGSLNAPQ